MDTENLTLTQKAQIQYLSAAYALRRDHPEILPGAELCVILEMGLALIQRIAPMELNEYLSQLAKTFENGGSVGDDALCELRNQLCETLELVANQNIGSE